MVLRALLAVVLLWPAAAKAEPQAAPTDPIPALLTRIQRAAVTGSPSAILALCTVQEGGEAEDFALTLSTPAPTRVVVSERDRTPLDARGFRLMVEVFAERGVEGRLSTWRLEVQPGEAAVDPWRITNVSRLSLVSGLYRLSVNQTKQYDLHDLTVRAPDITLTMTSGTAFVAETPEGPTAIVLIGHGRLQFTPSAIAERTQVRIFGGNEALTADVDAAFIRVRPSDFPSVFASASLRPRPPSPDDLRRATAVFDEYIGRTLQLELTDISRDRWSVTPASDDIIRALRTR
jgi:hypothetical protein